MKKTKENADETRNGWFFDHKIIRYYKEIDKSQEFFFRKRWGCFFKKHLQSDVFLSMTFQDFPRGFFIPWVPFDQEILHFL